VRLEAGADGRSRCRWAVGDDLSQRYHDLEWGLASLDDRALFEKLVLEGFQAGLSWITILRKRERFREVFHGFDIARVAAMTGTEVDALLQDPGIIRHRGKIEAAIHNAGRALELIDEAGSLAGFVWRYASPPGPAPSEIPATTDASAALALELKRRGWRFIGPTTAYAFMQAMGLVNDHLDGCVVRDEVEEERTIVLADLGI